MKIILRLSQFLVGVGGFSTIAVALSMTPYFLRATAYFVALLVPTYACLWICDQPLAESLDLELSEYYSLLIISKAVFLLGCLVTMGVIWHG